MRCKNVVEHYGKIIEILYGHPFEGWLNRARPSHPFWQKSTDWLNWLCPIRSVLKGTPVQNFNSFSIMFYYVIRTTYQKIGDLFCPVHISGLSHSVCSCCGEFPTSTQPYSWRYMIRHLAVTGIRPNQHAACFTRKAHKEAQQEAYVLPSQPCQWVTF